MTTPVSEIRARHEKSKADIQNNFGAAYSSRIEQDSYSIHEDRAALLAHCDVLAAENAVLRLELANLLSRVSLPTLFAGEVAPRFTLPPTPAGEGG